MQIHDERTAALCASPAGCAFLLVVEENDLSPEAASDPVLAVQIAAIALGQIDIWHSNHDEVVAEALAPGPRLMPLARAILAQPKAARWFAPLDRHAQWGIPWPGTEFSPEGLVTPASPPTSWERYAQKPRHALYSSTSVGAACSRLAAMGEGTGDYRFEPPVARLQVRIAPGARVFEVEGPDDWHELATRYPASDEDGRTVPDWGLAAKDWDAVHLTLGGLLTAEQVRAVRGSIWTEHRMWEAEQTAWLRWCFDAVERLPDLVEPIPPAIDLDEAAALHLPPRNTHSEKLIRPLS